MLLGCTAVLAVRPSSEIESAAHRIASGLEARFAALRGSTWPWPEPLLTYENALLPRALIAAGREGRRLPVAEVREQLQISDAELREDISVLNVVNFGGGAYVIYAEVLPTGEIEVDPEPYSDTFDRPARLLPIEANALVAAIDQVIGANPAQAGQFRAGDEKVFGWLVGQAMKATRGKANPQRLNELLRQRLLSPL